MWFNPFVSEIEPTLGSFWAPKGHENDEDADYLVLQDRRNDFDGVAFQAVFGRSGREYGWIGSDFLRKHYAPWNDPWKSQKEYARAAGFKWVDNFNGSKASS